MKQVKFGELKVYQRFTREGWDIMAMKIEPQKANVFSGFVNVFCDDGHRIYLDDNEEVFTND